MLFFEIIQSIFNLIFNSTLFSPYSITYHSAELEQLNKDLNYMLTYLINSVINMATIWLLWL